jgi:membrane-bound lytic murein transglycosylase B
VPDPLPPRPEPTAEPPAVDRYVLKPKPPAADDRKKARFDEWMREENEKRAAAAKEISDRALADVGADVEDVSLAVATQRHS